MIAGTSRLIASQHASTERNSNGPVKRLELADLFRQFAPAFLRKVRLPVSHHKVIRQITNCRTAVLGGHRQWCADCGFERYVYHSCRNRHCPKCQTMAKERWREARQAELLPVPYFHNVFTLPHELNKLILYSQDNQRQLINLLFQATADTLGEFGQQTFGGQIGFTAVLHTWDQQLRLHFHLHCLIASGALKKVGQSHTWLAGGNRFLFPVRGLSAMFRAKFLTGLKQLLAKDLLRLPPNLATQGQQHRLVQRLFKKSWVVYSKAPFAGPRKLLDYLSRYTHRVALTNQRLLKLAGDQVTLSYRDRRDGDRRKTMTLPAEKLIGRFLQHVLPSRLMRIRHYGFMANRYRKQRLARIRNLLAVDPPEDVQNDDSTSWLTDWIESILGATENICPCCGAGLIKSLLPCQLPPASPRQRNQRQQAGLRGPPPRQSPVHNHRFKRQ